MAVGVNAARGAWLSMSSSGFVLWLVPNRWSTKGLMSRVTWSGCRKMTPPPAKSSPWLMSRVRASSSMAASGSRLAEHGSIVGWTSSCHFRRASAIVMYGRGATRVSVPRSGSSLPIVSWDARVAFTARSAWRPSRIARKKDMASNHVRGTGMPTLGSSAGFASTIVSRRDLKLISDALPPATEHTHATPGWTLSRRLPEHPS